MRIAFFVNSIETEGPTFATGLLAMAALNRGHDVVYLTPGILPCAPMTPWRFMPLSSARKIQEARGVPCGTPGQGA